MSKEKHPVKFKVTGKLNINIEYTFQRILSIKH